MAIQPLAYRMRPKSLDEIVGQTHLVGKDKIIYRMVKAKQLSSMILYGHMGRLIEAGDLVSISRRMLVMAYEDIGLANPQAGAHTLAAIQTAEKVGFPEARIPLANAVIELCLSPKSNSAIMAIDAALADVRKGNSGEVPDYLRDGHYAGAEKLGRAIDYKYPHNYENGWVNQQYLPDRLKDKLYYEPKFTSKFEQTIAGVYQKINENKAKPE
nr:hypothetical protein [Listeria seeligeri]